MILNKSIRGVWIFISFLSISSHFLFIFFNKKSIPQENRSNSYIAFSLGIAAFILYHIRIYLDFPLASGVSEESTIYPKLRDLLLTLIVILSLSFLIYSILLDNAKRAMTSSNALTIRKYGLLKSSFFSFLSILPILIAVNYLSVIKNYNFDLTAKGKYSFSKNSRSIIQNVKKEIQIFAFYPRHLESSGPESSFALSMIRPDIEIILDQLKSINPLITVKFINADVETDLLGNIGQASNGSILIRTLKENSFTKNPFAEQRIAVQEPSDLEDIERKLTQSILNITTEEKIAYMTVTNGERFGAGFQNLPNEQINKFVSLLSFLNFKVQPIGLEKKWPPEIPNDANALLIIGPTVPLSKEAKNSIMDFVTKKNGSLFISVDPVGTEDFNWILEKANLTYNRAILSQPNDRYGILIAKNFGKHPIEEILDKKNLGLVFPYSGFFEKIQKKEKPIFETSLLVESGFESFIDLNSNGKFDTKEKKSNFQLGYALQLKDQPNNKNPTNSGSRVVVFSGTSWLTDQYFSLNINSGFAANSINWISQREVLQGIVSKKTEIQPISLTDNQKQIVWVFGMFVFPGLIAFSCSLFVYLRRKNSSG